MFICISPELWISDHRIRSITFASDRDGRPAYATVETDTGTLDVDAEQVRNLHDQLFSQRWLASDLPDAINTLGQELTSAIRAHT